MAGTKMSGAMKPSGKGTKCVGAMKPSGRKGGKKY